MRRELGIIQCILSYLLSIVAGFLWRVEGGSEDTKKDDAADRIYVGGEHEKRSCCALHEHRSFSSPMLGFKSFYAARRTLIGIELMHMIKKNQLVVGAKDEGRTAAELFYSLAV